MSENTKFHKNWRIYFRVTPSTMFLSHYLDNLKGYFNPIASSHNITKKQTKNNHIALH